jgi:hypothetical protein
MIEQDGPLDFGTDLDDVRARLAELSYFLAIEDLEAASEIFDRDDGFSYSAPAAFLSIASETAERPRLIGGPHTQEVVQQLSVLFVESSIRIDGGTRDRTEETRRMIMRQLVGWQPRGAGVALQYQRYLIRATGGGLVWGEILLGTIYRYKGA